MMADQLVGAFLAGMCLQLFSAWFRRALYL